MPDLFPHRPPTDRCPRPRAMHAGWRLWLAACLLSFIGALWPAAAQSDRPQFTEFDVTRTGDAVVLDFALRFELPRGVEDALQKGVPLYFVAGAEVYRSRWYWRDRQVASATRVWRVAFQPLTRKYRVSSDGQNENFDNLADALASVRRVSDWKIADAARIEDDAGHYVEFTYRLDTTLLPRPMQIGIGGQPEWTLLVEKSQRFR